MVETEVLMDSFGVLIPIELTIRERKVLINLYIGQPNKLAFFMEKTMQNPKLIPVPFANSGIKDDIPKVKSTSMSDEKASWETGFPEATMLPVYAGGLPPDGKDFNGVLNQISENLVFQSKGGRYKFDPDFALSIGGYPKGATLQTNDEAAEYQSLIDNNLVNFNTATPEEIAQAWRITGLGDAIEVLNGKFDKASVKNELGLSQTEVVSQKVVTEMGAGVVGSFEDGLNFIEELTSSDQQVTLENEFGKQPYYWDGDLPKQVPAGSTPQSTGGIGKGAWVSVGDASLRSDVKNGDGSLIGLDHGTLKDAINYVTPEMFGDTSGDAYDALQKALSSPLPCKLSAKTYRTSKPLYYDSMKVIEGAGEDLTRIVKYTNSKSGLGIISIDGKSMDYDVDAVLIARGSSQYWYNHFTRLSGFTLVREGDVEDIKKVFGWYAPLICQNSYANIHIEGQCTGVFTVDYWMLSWNRVESFCDSPWVLGSEDTPWIANGTSNVFNACWAHSAKGDNYAWDIRNIMYSEMIGCGTDKIGSNGNPCAGMMRFKNSRITLSNMGAEIIHATRLVRATDGSIVTLNQCDFFNVYNKYAPDTITWDNVNVLFQAVGNSTIIFDGTSVNAVYDFDSGLPNISSLAHAVDRSKIIWKGNSRSRPLLQEINRSAGDKKTKYGITWASSSKVQIHTEGIFIEDESDGVNQNLNTDVKTIENIHSTYRALRTSSYLESKSFELRGGHLDDLRVRGNITFHSPSAANNTISNGYPEDGGAYFINQYSTGGVGSNTRTIQEAIKTDDIGWVYKWMRGAEWGKPFGKWRKVGIS